MEIQENNTLLKRPAELECDVVRFQNQKDKWIAFVGLKDGRPYEIFTGLADDEMGIALPKSVTKGKIIKVVQEDGQKRVHALIRPGKPQSIRPDSCKIRIQFSRACCKMPLPRHCEAPKGLWQSVSPRIEDGFPRQRARWRGNDGR